MNNYSTYTGAGPPVWVYFIAVPFVIWMFCAFFGSMQPGHKIRCWKTVNGRRVRDYDAERRLRQDTKP